MFSARNARTRIVLAGSRLHRGPANRILAFAVVFALLFSLAAVSAAEGGPLTVTRGQHTRPKDAVPVPAEIGIAEDTLLSHGFESWPGPWSVWSATNTGWGRTTFDKTEGSYAAYCAASRIPAPGPYANNMNTWLTAGPFDLIGYDQGLL
ncbi:MAG TPA: hypothetical protein VLQ52_03015, partial [Coriobacteriia bacterium]|nr:hypothetical protein [Coriobacteriia bacterium]